MKERMINEDIMQMRKLFWFKLEGEITQAELERRVDEIIGRQLKIPEEKELAEAVK